MRLLVSSEEDPASCNMRELLLRKRGWEPAEAGEFGEGRLLVGDGMAMVTIEGIHIFEDHLDRRVGEILDVEFDEVVFLSRHRAASAIPTLTVHPIGNWGEAKFGGRDGDLVPATPSLMNGMLRRISELGSDLPFQISFEVTHHGPWLETPTVYIEIGSDESQWGHMGAAECLTDALLTVRDEDHPVLIGLGGGHYGPRFTDIALTRKANFGHMVPAHALDDADESSIQDMVSKAMDASGATAAYMHRKSMKRSRATLISSVLERMEVPLLRSEDLDLL